MYTVFAIIFGIISGNFFFLSISLSLSLSHYLIYSLRQLALLPLISIISPSDKQYFDRRTVLWAAVMFWSLATSLAGLSTTLTQLVS